MEWIKQFLKFNWMSKKFWIRLFLSLIAIIVIQKILGVIYITDSFAIGAMGFITAIIGIYSWKK